MPLAQQVGCPRAQHGRGMPPGSGARVDVQPEAFWENAAEKGVEQQRGIHGICGWLVGEGCGAKPRAGGTAPTWACKPWAPHPPWWGEGACKELSRLPFQGSNFREAEHIIHAVSLK